jgi:hypothetical protein
MSSVLRSKVASLSPSLRIEIPILRRASRCVADLIVVLIVMDINLGFMDPTHPIVAALFISASACGALRQMAAWRAGQRLPSVTSSFKHGWALVGVVSWFAATYAKAHPLFQWHVQMPFSVQAVGAGCLIFAVVTPFLRIGHLTRRAFDAYPHAIGSVLLTGSPIVAILVGAWIAGRGRTTWRAVRVDYPAAEASHAVLRLRAA